MSSTCQYFIIKEQELRADPENCRLDEGVSQIFLSGKCAHEKCAEQIVSCYGMMELCQISDAGRKD